MNKKISMEDLEDENIDSSISKLKEKEEILENKRARISDNETSAESKSKYWSILSFIFIGIFSSMIGWSIAEQITRPDTPNRPFSNIFNLNLSSVVFFMIVGFIIFFSIIYWDTLIYSLNRNSIISILKTLPLMLLIVFLSSLINDALFTLMRNNIIESTQSLNFDEIFGVLTFTRAGSWAVWGLLAGTIIGIFPSFNKKRLTNGAIGGFIGGAVGGYGFNMITKIIRGGYQTEIEAYGTYPGALGRFISMIFFGISIGIAIGLVKALRTKYWIEILSGGMAGKQFLFESNEITIGSLYTNDITLIKDPKIPDYACKINTQDSSAFLINDAELSFLEVDNMEVENNQKLENGSIIVVGDTVLKFLTGND